MLFSLCCALCVGCSDCCCRTRRSSARRRRRTSSFVLMVLRRQVRRPAYRRRDRVLLTACSQLLPRASWRAFLVTPQTLLRWHREMVRRKWTYRRRGVAGRPPIDEDVRGPHRRDGPGEPQVGLPSDPGGAPKARAPGRREHHPGDPPGRGARARPRGGEGPAGVSF